MLIWSQLFHFTGGPTLTGVMTSSLEGANEAFSGTVTAIVLTQEKFTVIFH